MANYSLVGILPTKEGIYDRAKNESHLKVQVTKNGNNYQGFIQHIKYNNSIKCTVDVRLKGEIYLTPQIAYHATFGILKQCVNSYEQNSVPVKVSSKGIPLNAERACKIAKLEMILQRLRKAKNDNTNVNTQKKKL